MINCVFCCRDHRCSFLADSPCPTILPQDFVEPQGTKQSYSESVTPSCSRSGSCHILRVTRCPHIHRLPRGTPLPTDPAISAPPHRTAFIFQLGLPLTFHSFRLASRSAAVLSFYSNKKIQNVKWVHSGQHFNDFLLAAPTAYTQTRALHTARDRIGPGGRPEQIPGRRSGLEHVPSMAYAFGRVFR